MKYINNKAIQIILLLSGSFLSVFNLLNISYMPQTISENNTKSLTGMTMEIKTLIEGGYYYYDEINIILIAVGVSLIVLGVISKRFL